VACIAPVIQVWLWFLYNGKLKDGVEVNADGALCKSIDSKNRGEQVFTLVEAEVLVDWS